MQATARQKMNPRKLEAKRATSGKAVKLGGDKAEKPHVRIKGRMPKGSTYQTADVDLDNPDAPPPADAPSADAPADGSSDAPTAAGRGKGKRNWKKRAETKSDLLDKARDTIKDLKGKAKDLINDTRRNSRDNKDAKNDADSAEGGLSTTAKWTIGGIAAVILAILLMKKKG